eukprot:6457225-Amphidinium_carterae.1
MGRVGELVEHRSKWESLSPEDAGSAQHLRSCSKQLTLNSPLDWKPKLCIQRTGLKRGKPQR